MRRRPSPRRSGAVARLLALLVLLAVTAACSDTVSVEAPHVSGNAARVCAAFVDSLPSHVADQKQRKVTTSGHAAAWGDPAIELRCGVPRPKGFDRFSQCQHVNGVDWFVPESQQTGKPTEITMTTVGRTPRVDVRIPADYWPPATAMADLATVTKQHLREVRPCQ
jgi:hypothetical protein